MKLQSYGFCVIRRPLLSRNVLEVFHASTGAVSAEFETELRSIFSDPLLLEGLQLASGPLYGLAKYLLEGKTVIGKDKILAALYKFLIRASSRCTPFGLFAGYFHVQTGESTQIRFHKQNPLKIRNSLDALAQRVIRAQILKNSKLTPQILLYPNSSLYRAGLSYRYLKRQEGHQQEPSFVLTQVTLDPVLEKILTEARMGILPARIKEILKSENLSARVAQTYTEALIHSQLLTDSLELNVTGEDYLEYLIITLSTLKNTQPITAALQRIQTQLRHSAPAEQINASLKAFIKADHPLERTLQTTLAFQTTQASISRKVLTGLGAQLSALSALAQQSNSEHLADFTSRFFARYGQQPVPLLLALDYEYGIGYGTLSQQTLPALPLLGGLANEIPPKRRRRPIILQMRFIKPCLKTKITRSF